MDHQTRAWFVVIFWARGILRHLILCILVIIWPKPSRYNQNSTTHNLNAMLPGPLRRRRVDLKLPGCGHNDASTTGGLRHLGPSRYPVMEPRVAAVPAFIRRARQRLHAQCKHKSPACQSGLPSRCARDRVAPHHAQSMLQLILPWLSQAKTCQKEQSGVRKSATWPKKSLRRYCAAARGSQIM